MNTCPKRCGEQVLHTCEECLLVPKRGTLQRNFRESNSEQVLDVLSTVISVAKNTNSVFIIVNHANLLHQFLDLSDTRFVRIRFVRFFCFDPHTRFVIAIFDLSEFLADLSCIFYQKYQIDIKIRLFWSEIIVVKRITTCT